MVSGVSKNKPRVVVAMSGGVDSSVAAALMVEQGFDVIGVMMRLWSEDGKAMLNRCCTPEQMDDARHIAAMLGIPFYVLDVKDYFRKTIVEFFLNEHGRGRTPNPCVECNREIRFGYLYERAMALDADFLATGHYAQIKPEEDGLLALHMGEDEHKDQSYVLHVLNQTHLAHTKFPVGEYTKPEVRHLAEEFGLPTASKGDSMDLCFLSGEDYRTFLTRHRPASDQPGPILTADGQQIGTHQGLAHYTIGQRKGLGVPSAIPLFVTGKNEASNALVLGERHDATRHKLHARRINWISGTPPATPFETTAKIRYKAQPKPATITPLEGERATVNFADPVFGITPGQAAVFYDGSKCLGGGIIDD